MFVWSKLSSLTWVDAWQERFSGTDTPAVITQIPGRKTIRVEVYCAQKRQAQAIVKMFGGRVRTLRKQNWAALHLEPAPPIKVRDTLVVCGARTGAEIRQARRDFPGREIIAIPPDMAFGTGHHATTATVLRMLVDCASSLNKAGRKWSLADLGCGSGILAIAAAKLGARDVWGCDFDPLAVKVAKENLERNAVPNVTLVRKDVLKWQPQRQWDIVVANIFYDILDAALPDLVSAVKTGGILIISGILKTQAKSCLEAGARQGATWSRIVTKGKWVTALGIVGDEISSATAAARR